MRRQEGETFAGHLSLDFFVEDADPDRLHQDPDAHVTLYPIVCSPGLIQRVCYSMAPPIMADAGPSLLDKSSGPVQNASTATNGVSNTDTIVVPRCPSIRYF